jgi:DNA helicase MCM9
LFDEALKTNALTFFEKWDQSLVAAQKLMLVASSQAASQMGWTLKTKVHARLRVSQVPPFWCPNMPRSEEVGLFKLVSGTVVRAGKMKLVERQREMTCGKCGHSFVLRATVERDLGFPEVLSCPGGDDCASKQFTVVPGSEVFKDYQEIKIQEQMQKLEFGSIPRSMYVILEDDLVDSCKAGDDITIGGVVLRRWRSTPREERPLVDIVFVANNVMQSKEEKAAQLHEELTLEMDQFWKEHEPERRFQARAKILASICPQLYGMDICKLATLLVVIGGVPGVHEGMTIRGQCHLLLVGDAGVGKSQFLQFAAKMSTRAVMTTGVGSTSAGLTVAAVRGEGGDWMLEAGALVLADGGVCAIDEFDSISKNDARSIHEAMEQCCLSVAKAGMVCKLDTRTSVIAAMNAKGKYDRTQSISVNTAIGSPLLSRFDLILILEDRVDPDHDTRVSNFILNRTTEAGPEVPVLFTTEKMQAYVSLIKAKFQPVLHIEAQKLIEAYYLYQRKRDSNASARTTIRLMESLIRLAQAHARLMWRNEVLLEDAAEVIWLTEMSQSTTGLCRVIPATTKIVHEDPDMVSAELVFDLMKGLGLDRDPVFRAYLPDDGQSALPPPALASAPVQKQAMLSPGPAPNGGASGVSSSSGDAQQVPYEMLSQYSRAELDRQKQSQKQSPQQSQPQIQQQQQHRLPPVAPVSSQLRLMQEQAARWQADAERVEQERLKREEEEARQATEAFRVAEARRVREAEINCLNAAMELELQLEDEITVQQPVVQRVEPPQPAPQQLPQEPAQKRSRKKFLE